MPMYYFDTIAHDGSILRDELGVDLPDLEAARREAREDALTIACQRGEDHLRTIVKVRDEQREVFTVSVHLLVIVSTASS
jgi:hypothetical protein